MQKPQFNLPQQLFQVDHTTGNYEYLIYNKPYLWRGELSPLFFLLSQSWLEGGFILQGPVVRSPFS